MFNHEDQNLKKKKKKNPSDMFGDVLNNLCP